MEEKFNERFDLEVGVEDARRRFVNRAHDLVYHDFWGKLGTGSSMAHSVDAVAFELGDERRGN